MKETFVDIAIPGTPRESYTYQYRGDIGKTLTPGQRCLVPLGRRKAIGYYIRPATDTPSITLKTIIDLLEQESFFERELFNFLVWVSDYYFANIADVLNAAIPPSLRKLKNPSYYPGQNWETVGNISEAIIKMIKTKGYIGSRGAALLEGKYPGLITRLIGEGILRAAYGREKKIAAEEILGNRFDYVRGRTEINTITPNQEQTEAIKDITANLRHFAPFLLYGITGSGKTLIYCHTAREVLKRNKTVLVMVIQAG
ncbi:MAG: DEAD/DEAH box helicase family protein [candidate division Zixibacteria bacterium]|nr:DEAD/DEAH box helicase family protein [candidate division Zixibacteria bacterium]